MAHFVSTHGRKSDRYIGGTDGDDRLVGNEENNTIEGFGGADYIRGGGGKDGAKYAHSNAGVTVDLNLVNVPQTSAGDANGDRLSQIENIWGSDFADTLIGDEKANTLTGGGGAGDRLYGGGGADRLSVENTPGMVDGGAGHDILEVYLALETSSISLNDSNFSGIEEIRIINNGLLDMSGVSAANAPRLITALSYTNTVSIIGTQGDDRIRVDGSGDTVEGGKGADRIFGSDNDETFVASMANFGRDIYYNVTLKEGGDVYFDTFDVSSFAASADHLFFAAIHGGRDTLVYGDNGRKGESFVIKGISAEDVQASVYFVFGSNA